MKRKGCAELFWNLPFALRRREVSKNARQGMDRTAQSINEAFLCLAPDGRRFSEEIVSKSQTTGF
jgi:hypothetical protein